MPSCVARKMTWLPSVSWAGDELVVLVDADGDDAAAHDVGEVLERGLLTVPLRVAKRTNLPSSSRSRTPRM